MGKEPVLAAVLLGASEEIFGKSDGFGAFEDGAPVLFASPDDCAAPEDCGAGVADAPWPSGCERLARSGRPCARTVGATARSRPTRAVEGRIAKCVCT